MSTTPLVLQFSMPPTSRSSYSRQIISDHGEQGLDYVLTGGLVEPVQGGGDSAGQLLCEAGPDPDGEVHEPGGRLQLLHQRGVASPRGRASLPGGKKANGNPR